MASPSMTQNAYANLASGVSIVASGTSAAVAVAATTKFEVQLQFDVLTGGTAQAAGTATIKIYRLFGAGPLSDTVPITQLAISMGTASTHFIQSLALPTGNYSVTVTNGDSVNAISYSLTSSSIDSIA
ncbi:MAG: hypothetical protein JWL77_3585 [Chthonomonadaceae bacterium]|nr:hypothetical protein [Chthonomonadaceae bacterium]